MAKRQHLKLGNSMSVDAIPDQWNGMYYVGYRSGCSMLFRDPKALRAFLRLPKGLPTRQLLDDWLAGLQGEPVATPEPSQEKTPNLSPELLATGWGPEVHAGDVDNDNTKMIT